MRKVLIFTLLMFVVTFEAAAQLERSDIRKGNRFFEDEDYNEAEVEYLRALGKNPKSYEANFNLGGSFFKQQRFKDAQETFMKSVKDSSRVDLTAQALYNLGTSYLAERKLDESIETLKNALKMNPTDTLAKYNLAYAKLLKKEQENQDQDKDNEDQDQDKENQDQDDQDENQDQDKDDEGKDDQNQDDEGEDEEEQSEPEPKDGQMTQEEAEQLLEAMQAQEDKTKDKMGEKKKGVVVGRSGKNW